MIKSGKALKVFYPKLTHITCMAHGLHRVSEAIRDKYPKVEMLISNKKNIFKSTFSSFYYCKNFDKVKEVINTFNENDAISIQKVQDLFKDNSIKNELAVILANFQCITETILQIEKSGANLRETISLVKNVEIRLSEGGIGIEFAKLKLMHVLSKNPGYSQIIKICGILSGEISNDNEGTEELTPEDISCFNFVLEYGTDIFKTDGSILFCKLCEVKVNSDRKFVVTQHVNTEKHKRAVIRKNEKNKNSEIQQLVANTPKKCLFSHDLCKALLSANIPLYKISNPQLKSFLEKYTSREIPSDSTLRKTYVNDIYEETVKNIREQIKGNKIWVSIDETTDSEGRYVANVIIGTLNTDAPGKTYLLTTEVLEKVNNSTIVKLFDHSMFVLWPNGIRHDDVLLFVTDAAPYMVKAGLTLQSLYSKMIHLTCLAHGIHRVAENIREKFKKVDKLISRVKQVFLKAPSRVLVFKSEAPAIPLPPEPILTRWGTWIIAASYYCKYYQVIRRVLLSLNAEDAISVKEAQQLIQEPDMEANLVYIHSNFGFIPEYITKLETQYISLSEALSAVKYVQNKLNDCEGEIGVTVFQKLNNVLEKNCDFKTILKISKILSGQESSMEGLPDDFTGDDITYFKYAPITSTDVERSFSRYKTLLVDNRRSFNFENIKKSLVVQCNTFEGRNKIISNAF
ncbi:hypothetical protein QTP88_001483 [Uroleucon formosanum]